MEEQKDCRGGATERLYSRAISPMSQDVRGGFMQRKSPADNTCQTGVFARESSDSGGDAELGHRDDASWLFGEPDPLGTSERLTLRLRFIAAHEIAVERQKELANGLASNITHVVHLTAPELAPTRGDFTLAGKKFPRHAVALPEKPVRPEIPDEGFGDHETAQFVEPKWPVLGFFGRRILRRMYLHEVEDGEAGLTRPERPRNGFGTSDEVVVAVVPAVMEPELGRNFTHELPPWQRDG